MDAMNFEFVIGKIREKAAEYGLEEKENGSFQKGDLLFKVDYNTEAKTFVLLCKEGAEGEEIETNLSVWLFDETHRKKDAETIGEDFCDCIRKKLGIARAKVTAGVADVALPTRTNKDGALTMDQFTQRFLAVYPQYKDEYKANVSVYGSFMPIEFYKNYGVEKFREIAAGDNKKQLDKMLSMLNEFYCQGDRQVSDLIMAVFFGGTFCEDKALYDSVYGSMGEYPFLRSGSMEIVSVAQKNKKFKALFN